MKRIEVKLSGVLTMILNCLKCLEPKTPDSGHYGMHSDCFRKWFNVFDNALFSDLTIRSSASVSHSDDAHQHNSSFFHGKFKKYSATLNNRSFILKMRQPEAPELPEVEYLCNQIAIELGVPVAEFFIINFEGELVFVTENFVHSSTVPVDLQHIYHFRKSDQHTCKDLISIIKEKTKRPHYIEILIKTILFDSLIGNHDRHGRNLGFLITPNNCELAPIYDNVTYLGLETGNMLKADYNPRGRIATGHTEEPSMKDYVLELRKLGFEEEVSDFYHELCLERINRLIEESFCSHLMKQAIKKMINKRYLELKNEFRT